MDDIRKKISNFTLKLQSQTHLPLWALTNESVIYSVAIEKKPEWGPRTRILRQIMNIAYKINAADLIIFFVGISRAISMWWWVKKKSFKEKERRKFNKIFVGFGASSEEYLYADYVNQSKNSVLRINWLTQEGVHELTCPSIISILYSITQNAFGYTAKLRSAAQEEILVNAVDFLTICAFNIGAYAFYQSYWRIAKSRGIDEVVFLAVDIPTFACVDENIKTIYLQHGLIALSIIIPKLHRVDVLTVDEEFYLKTSLKNVQIFRTTREIKGEGIKNNVLMLLSLNIFQEERLLACESLVRWAIRMGLQVVIRPTCKVNKDELAAISKKIPEALFDDLTLALNLSLEKWRPKLVAAWTSTGLTTALDYGCLPISLYDPLANEIWCNMIYPMRNRVLFWPRDESLIEIATQSKDSYYSQLMNLRSYQNQCLEV